MNKKAQEAVTAKCMVEYNKAMVEMKVGYENKGRLRTCTAEVLETAGYWILKSYNTIVAVTSKDTGICYDVLRVVYGYTSTSNQHIAKFTHDYHTAEYKWSAPKWTAR